MTEHEEDSDAKLYGSAMATAWWNLAFKGADVLFKLISWLLVIIAVRAAGEVSGSAWLHWLGVALHWVYALVLFALSYFLFAGIYDRRLVPAGWFGFFRIAGGLAGLALTAFLVPPSPLAPLDQIIEALAAGLRR